MTAKKNRKMTPLEAKLAKNRARGMPTAPALAAQIVREYQSEPDASYRSLAKRHGIGMGTVRRIITRAVALGATLATVLLLCLDGWT
jgi:hypothetical protein